MSEAAKKVEANTDDTNKNKAATDTNGGDDANNAAKKPDAAGAEDAGSDDKKVVSLYKPEGIAEHFIGKSDQETIYKLNEAVLGFRKDLSKKGVPEKADGYELKLPDEIKAKVLRVGEDGKDPLLEKMKPIFHKYNIPATAFQEIITEYATAALEYSGAGGDASGEGAADFEYKSLGGIEKAQASLDGANVWLNGLVQNEKISEETAKELKLMTSYSEGLKALLEIRGMSGEAPIPADFKGSAPDKITKEMLDSRVADPKYWSDPVFYKETTEMFAKFYGAAKK